MIIGRIKIPGDKSMSHRAALLSALWEGESVFTNFNDIVITNHDAVKWLMENPQYLEGFSMLVVDESTAFKHRTSARSKAMRKLSKRWLVNSMGRSISSPDPIPSPFRNLNK